MPHATATAVSLHGAVGYLVECQVDVSPGQVGTTLVGRADTALNESRDRCRMAIVNSDLPWPATRRITILLSPADLSKRGTHFDLAIAVATLAAAGSIEPGALNGCLFIGELAIDGGLRTVGGLLPMVLAASSQGIGRVFVPEPQLEEAALVEGVEVLGVRSLAQVVALLSGEPIPPARPVPVGASAPLLGRVGELQREDADMADLFGLADVRYAVEVAAAGGHHLLLNGPKGAGKTSIAERIPTILPDLNRAEAIQLAAIRSLAGTLDPADGYTRRPPFSAPHHDASKAAIVGGGSGTISPGEISRSHGGVLFLDEFPLFRADVVEALREPLESGEITVARRDEMVTLPARSMLVLAANPCPCGAYTGNSRENRCQCHETARRRYQARLGGPVIDRIDVTRHVEPPRAHERDDPLAHPEASATIRRRVELVRALQAERYADTPWHLNALVPAPRIRERWPLAEEAQHHLDSEVYAGRLTGRGAVRVMRLAWTVRDLAAVCGESAAQPDLGHVEMALCLRRGLPLPASVLARREMVEGDAVTRFQDAG